MAENVHTFSLYTSTYSVGTYKTHKQRYKYLQIILGPTRVTIPRLCWGQKLHSLPLRHQQLKSEPQYRDHTKCSFVVFESATLRPIIVVDMLIWTILLNFIKLRRVEVTHYRTFVFLFLLYYFSITNFTYFSLFQVFLKLMPSETITTERENVVIINKY